VDLHAHWRDYDLATINLAMPFKEFRKALLWVMRSGAFGGSYSALKMKIWNMSKEERENLVLMESLDQM